MNNPLLSVIVPIYNVQPYLERCVNSILNQTYKNLEVILVDDGSPDKCPELCDQFAAKDSRVKVLHKTNGGLSSARNHGLKIATANYITFVDSDDWIEPQTYTTSMEILLSSNADLVFFDYILSDAKKTIVQPKPKTCLYSHDHALKLFLRGAIKNHNNCPVWNKIYKKELLEGISFSEGQLFEDNHYSAQVFNKAKTVACTNQIFYNYYQQSSSITKSKTTPKKMDIVTECKKIYDMFKGTKYQKISYQIYIKAYYLILFYLCKDPNYPRDFYTIENQKNWVSLLRKNYFFMMTSPLNLKQKIAYSFFCINYFAVQKLLAKFC